MIKVCKVCGVGKAKDGFSKWGGLLCKECYPKYAYNRRLPNKKNLDRSTRNSYLKKFYGMTYEDYEEMLKNQGGGCKICGCIPENNIRAGKQNHLFVDHDHDTGKVRGILCYRCNTAISYFREDIKLVKKAVEYLT